MDTSKIFTVLAFAVVFSLVIPLSGSYSENLVYALPPESSSNSEELTNLQIELKFANGDRAGAYQKHFVIYQDHDSTPFLEREFETIPDSVLLPQGHQYKVEVFVNGLYSETGIVKLQDSPEKLDIILPLSGGIKFNVFFEDGETPINNALVEIKNKDGTVQQSGNTNDQGDTLRYWLQPTILEDDYYIADIYLGGFLATSVSGIQVTQGVQQEQKIVVPIPEVVEELITFKLYSSDTQKVFKKDGKFSILLTDQKNVNVIESPMSSKGDIYFSSIPSALYSVSVLKDGVVDNSWPETKLAIVGNQTDFNLYKISEPITIPFAEIESPLSGESISVIIEDTPSIPLAEPIVYESTIKEYTLSCNCISFRMDDIQDYWLSNVQVALFDMFSKHNVPLTIGIIVGDFGEDTVIVDAVKKGMKKGDLEIANHSTEHVPVTEITKEELDYMLKTSQKQLKEKLGVTPTTFIAPQNEINSDTIPVLIENGFTALSANMDWDTPPYSLQNESLHRFPEGATTGVYDEKTGGFIPQTATDTFSNALKSINDHGFSVITLHPSEFSIPKDGVLQNEANMEQLHELEKLFEIIKSENITLVNLGKIKSKVHKIYVEPEVNPLDSNVIPSWFKNNAGWWRDGQIDDETFVHGVQYLVNKKVIPIVPTTDGSGSSEIPNWVKVNSGLWAENRISEDDFVLGLTFLVNQEIITIDI